MKLKEGALIRQLYSKGLLEGFRASLRSFLDDLYAELAHSAHNKIMRLKMLWA